MIRLIPDIAWRERLSIAIDAYCASTLDGGAPILGKSAVLSTAPETLSDLSKRLGVRTGRIAQAIDQSATESETVRLTATGRRRRVVSATSAARVAQALSEPLAMKTAARLLGLPPSRVRALVEAGMLTSSEERLLRSEVQRLASTPFPKRGDFRAGVGT